jgi:hypothetical protein
MQRLGFDHRDHRQGRTYSEDQSRGTSTGPHQVHGLQRLGQDNNFVTEHYIVTQHKAVWLLVLFAMNWERAKSQVSCHRLRQEACRRLGLEPISPEPIFRDRPDSAVRRALAATFNIDVLELPSKSYRELIEDWATVTVR